MKKIWKILIAFAVGATLAVLIMVGFGVFTESDTQELMKRLSDSFFIPGMVLAGFGLLVFASNGGIFDMLSYGVMTLIDLLRFDLSKRKYKDYYEYKKAKREKKKMDFDYLIYAGLALVFVAVVFLIFYYQFD